MNISTASDDYQPHGHLPHPYYPVEAEIVGYLANTYSVAFLLANFAAGCSVLFLVTALVATRINNRLSRSELSTVLWFVLSASTSRPTVEEKPPTDIFSSCSRIHSRLLRRYTTDKRALYLMETNSHGRETDGAARQLKDTMHTTTERWAAFRQSSGRCGRSTRCPTRDT